jgi:hypothetical protein
MCKQLASVRKIGIEKKILRQRPLNSFGSASLVIIFKNASMCLASAVLCLGERNFPC